MENTSYTSEKNTCSDKQMHNDHPQASTGEEKPVNGFMISDIRKKFPKLIQLAQQYGLLLNDDTKERQDEICNILESSIREIRKEKDARIDLAKMIYVLGNELCNRQIDNKKISIAGYAYKHTIVGGRRMEKLFNTLMELLLESYSEDELANEKYAKFYSRIKNKQNTITLNEIEILIEIEEEIQKRPDEHYIGAFLNDSCIKLLEKGIMKKNKIFLKHKHAAFIYDAIHDMGVISLNKKLSNIDKRDYVRKEIKKVNKQF